MVVSSNNANKIRYKIWKIYNKKIAFVGGLVQSLLQHLHMYKITRVWTLPALKYCDNAVNYEKKFYKINIRKKTFSKLSIIPTPLQDKQNEMFKSKIYEPLCSDVTLPIKKMWWQCVWAASSLILWNSNWKFMAEHTRTSFLKSKSDVL